MIMKICPIIRELFLYIITILFLTFIAILGFTFTGTLTYLMTISKCTEEIGFYLLFCILFIAIGCTGVRYTKTEIFNLIETWQESIKHM